MGFTSDRQPRSRVDGRMADRVAPRSRVAALLAVACLAGAAAGALLAQRLQRATPAASARPGDDGVTVAAQLAALPVRAGRQDLVIEVAAPATHLSPRPPVSIALVIDRSLSMTGAPLANAVAAARRLVGSLGPADAFAVISYGSTAEVVVAMRRATPANQRAAGVALDAIAAAGGTCISCGLSRGAAELARSPNASGARRVVLVADGQANLGVTDRDDLAALAAATASGGATVTAVGVGLEFDERAMLAIAERGGGNYQFVEDTRDLPAMFDAELADLAATIGVGARLVLPAVPGIRVVSSPELRIADLRAGARTRVVIQVEVDAPAGSSLAQPVELAWSRATDGAPRRAEAHVHGVVAR